MSRVEAVKYASCPIAMTKGFTERDVFITTYCDQLKLYTRRYAPEVMLSKYVSGIIDQAIEKISMYKNETDIMVLDLPMMGDLLKNGLDTIRILKDHIIPKL